MYDALASFIWNCGTDAVSANKEVGKGLRSRDWQGAADAMLAWNTVAGVVVQGLVNRRHREHTLFLTAVGHTDRYYLTKSERDTVETLERERKIATRHGGWEHIDASHLKIAARARQDLRQRLEVLTKLDPAKLHRRQRIQALKDIIG